MDRFEGKIFGWHWAKNIRIKSRIGKFWWDIRSGGREVHLNPPPVAELCWQATIEDGAMGAAVDLHKEERQLTTRARATEGGRPLEAWANSVSVWCGMVAAEASSRGACLAEEEDNIGPIGQSHSNGPSYSNGPNCFPNLTADTNGQSC
ncbi:hypothetical protein M9H77_08984 [Catharanthus roseus]|uniref:Uncharacterized protein n=1 Tax=Catharanthus roseus TaxID=4058 RepID=A0ACC0BZB2_CATRO|nr:hypothetical protein M9H77_08984 [Catharanthus roseus]